VRAERGVGPGEVGEQVGSAAHHTDTRARSPNLSATY
jgi:hypothetical protein